MANREKYCYYAPVLKKNQPEWFEQEVEQAKRIIDDVTEKIYNGEFPSDAKCSKRIHAFNGCTPIYLPDKDKEMHLGQIRSVLEEVFMRGRMFEMAQQRSAENNK